MFVALTISLALLAQAPAPVPYGYSPDPGPGPWAWVPSPPNGYWITVRPPVVAAPRQPTQIRRYYEPQPCRPVRRRRKDHQ
jgi:hypothetical protein